MMPSRRLSDDGPTAAAFLRVLDAVGDRIDDLGPDREIVAHWPFVGTDFRGLMIAGQALDGWDADVSSARWRLEDMRDREARQGLLRGAQDWSRDEDEPIWEVVQRGNRRGKPFWGLSRRVVSTLEPEGTTPWFGRYAWWNVFPLAPPRGSPYGLLKEIQAPLVGELFWTGVHELGVDRILLVSGRTGGGRSEAYLGCRTFDRAVGS